MALRFDDKLPIYQQLCDYFETQILNGSLSTGQKLQSVRDLATEIGVNPNTMQKALSILESRGLMFTERTSGRFITIDESTIEKLRDEKTEYIIERFFDDMRKIGYDHERVITLLCKNHPPQAQ